MCVCEDAAGLDTLQGYIGYVHRLDRSVANAIRQKQVKGYYRGTAKLDDVNRKIAFTEA